jgi:hypothetical protein
LGDHCTFSECCALMPGRGLKKGETGMVIYALFLVVLGNGNISSSQPLRVTNYLSLASCQAAALEATTTGFDGNASPGFVCVRIAGETRQAAINSTKRIR